MACHPAKGEGKGKGDEFVGNGKGWELKKNVGGCGCGLEGRKIRKELLNDKLPTPVGWLPFPSLAWKEDGKWS